MRPLSVGILSWAYPPEKSGLSRAAREIGEALAAAGQDVRVITLDRQGHSDRCGVQIVGASDLVSALSVRGIARKLPAFGHFSAPSAFHKAVLREHARRPFDIIEGTNWYAPGYGLARSGAIPYITRHSTPAATSIEQAPTIRNRADAAMARWAEKTAARHSAGHISNTAAHSEKVSRLYDIAPFGDRHVVIGLSLPAAILNAANAVRYDAKPSGPVQILFIGRAEARKGVDILLGALAILAAERKGGSPPDFHLTCVGLQDRDIAEMDGHACRYLTIHHRVEEAHLHELLAAAHIVAAPSRYESFGLVYQEALAFGRPVAALAEDASAREFLGKTGAGHLAQASTPEAYAGVLRGMVSSSDLRRNMSRRARSAAGRFTRATLADDTLSLYRAILGPATVRERA